jgi:hypothetical protein
MNENTTKHSTGADKPKAANPQVRGGAQQTFYSLLAVVWLMLIASVGHAETYQIISTQNSKAID